MENLSNSVLSEDDPELLGATSTIAATPTPKAASPSDCETVAPNQAATASYLSRHRLLEKAKGHVPRTIHSLSRKVWTYLKGPQPPRLWKIRPFFPRLQQFPLRLADRICPRRWQRILALFLFYVCWIVTFGAVLHKSSVTGDVNGYGQPILLNCGGIFWYVLSLISQVLIWETTYTHT